MLRLYGCECSRLLLLLGSAFLFGCAGFRCTCFGCGFGWSFVGSRRAARVDQVESVFRVERERANGRLSSGAEGDVNAAVLGQSQDFGVAIELRFLRCGDVLFLVYGLFDLFRSHGLFNAQALRFNGVRGDALGNEVSLGALHATFRKFLVVFRSATRIGMALQDQVSIRFESQILLEVAGKGKQGPLLAGQQPAGYGTILSGLCGGEVNAVQREPLFKLRLFLGLLYRDLRSGMGLTAAAVAGRAGDGVCAGSDAGGIKLNAGAGASYAAAAGCVAIGQRVIVSVRCLGCNGGLLADGDSGRVRVAGRDNGRCVGLLFDGYIS